MKRIFIITLNNSSPKGGSEKLWRELALELKTRKHDVSASVLLHQAKLQASVLGSNVRLLKRIPKRYGNNTAARLGFYLIGSLVEIHQLRRHLKSIKPDFVFLSFGGFAELDNAKLLRLFCSMEIPFAAVFHSNTENYVFQKASISLAKDFCKQSKDIYVVSHRIAEIFKRQVGYQGFNYRIAINPMIEPSSGTLDIYKDNNSPVFMAFIGTLDISVKGIALLLQALAEFNAYGSEWYLNLFGEGIDADTIQTLINEFQLSDRVNLKGWTNDIDSVWSTHHLLVLPSFNEGMPMVIHEAMLRQRVVLATDVGGNSEIIDHQKTGFLALAPTLKQIRAMLDEAFLLRDQWGNIARNARESIIEIRQKDHSIFDMIDQIENELH